MIVLHGLMNVISLPQINLGGEEHLKEKSNISGHVVIDTDLKDIEDLTTESIRQIDKLKERYKLLDINEILVVQQNTEQYFRLLKGIFYPVMD